MSQTLETLDGRPNCYTRCENEAIDWSSNCTDLAQFCGQAALDMVAEAIVFFSGTTARLVHMNQAAIDCLGYPRNQLLSMSLRDVAPQATSSNLEDLYRRAMRAPSREVRVRTVYCHRKGSLIPVRCSIRAIPTSAENVFVAVIKTPRARIEETFRANFANRDSLTLLPNRAWFWRRLEREARSARQSKRSFALLFIDIDRFKSINDSFGHLAGDHVLQAVARRLLASVRPQDVIARVGGDEFVVLLDNVQNETEILRIAKRIGGRIGAEGKRRGDTDWQAQVTLSIGAAICTGKGASAVDVFERADHAMYRAKALARDGRIVIDESCETFTPSTEICTAVADPTANSSELD
jgi:diguanylate cyclase (GGDEF)-like protein/PAS domain S-box-containing protein